MEFKDNSDEIIASLGTRANMVLRAMERGLSEGMRQFEGQRIIKEQLSGRKSANYGLNRQTGTGARSWVLKNFNRGKDYVSVLGLLKSAWYLKLHQHVDTGDILTARGGKLFAVPVHRDAKGHRPRDFSNLVMIPRKNKPPMLVRQVRRGDSSRRGATTAGAVRTIQREDIMYILTKTIRMPKRLHITEEFQTYGKKLIEVNINQALKEALK